MIPSLSKISKVLSNADLGQLPAFNITVLRNITVEPIEPYLQYLGYQSDLNCDIRFGDYDTIVQDAMAGEAELLGENTNCVLIFARLENLSWPLARNFAGLDGAAITAEVERISQFVETAVAAIRRHTKVLILWHGLELPSYPATGILDSQGSSGQRSVIASLNETICSILAATESAYFVDLDGCFSRLGYDACLDNRFWHIARAPYTTRALGETAAEDFKFIRAALGRNKKCLVLDCDNVLWGGIVGEDGVAGIQLAAEHPGSPYREFQQEVVNLYHRGVILALCSKNNAEDVWEVFREHPNMVIQEDHIAASEINWNDKASNLRRLADKLNIGLDSMVFADDSEHEIALVKRELPEVTTLHLPPSKAVENRDILAGLGLFDSIAMTEEDANRGAMYQAERERQNQRGAATDIESYCRSLEMVLSISLADVGSIPRVAQQTQKTNQFNLTTRRYGEAEIGDFAASANHDVATLRVTDVFGDSGIVGTCIVHYEENSAVLDTFLLSCRALGRGIEKAFLAAMLERTRHKGATTMVGEYIPSKKNAQAKDFLVNCGFSEIPASGHDNSRKFAYNLEVAPDFAPTFFKEITVDF
jgi:FkbH-like protein